MNDKMSVKKKRYIAVMLLGLALNIGLYWISHIFKLPMWLDTVGTAVTAVALEPAAGLVIGYATNLFESSAIYMSGTIVFYAITAACALIFGVMLRKNGRVSWRRLPLAAVSYVLASSVLSALITLWSTGAPDSGWELALYLAAKARGVAPFLANVIAAGALKVADTAVMCAALPLVWRLLPCSLKNETLESGVTWNSPFK